MKYVQLVHDKMLGLASEKKVLALNMSKIDGVKADILLTFRKIAKEYHPEYERNVHACKRFINKYDGDIVCYALENDSPVAPIILWDIVHTLSLGNKIYMLGEGGKALYLEKEYFKDSIQKVREDKECIVFEKTAILPAEKDAGMDDWTFGIPVGPEDATVLNSLVERILSFKCAKKEIILCGKPGDNFKYNNEVRIVGEDIPAPPVQISRKKNLLIEEAKYNNLCILHDRVMLPVDFIEQMKRYGDYYSFTTLQSVYFDDYHNFVPIRYSDFNNIYSENGVFNVIGIKRHWDIKGTSYNENLLPEIEKQGFTYASPLNYGEKMYPTGSLYILKKSVGLIYRMDNRLTWEQFEDVEYGTRMNKNGVITRVNPYTFSQSLIARAAILFRYSINYYDASNRYYFWKSNRHKLGLKFKPLFKMDEEKAWENLDKFRKVYCDDIYLVRENLTNFTRINIINRLIISAKFKHTRTEIDKFIKNVSSLLFLNKFSYSDEEYYKELLYNDPIKGKCGLVMCNSLISQGSLRKRGKLFYDSMNDYYICKNLFSLMGSLSSAIQMRRMQGKLYYNPDGIRGFYKAILNSSPWSERN